MQPFELLAFQHQAPAEVSYRMSVLMLLVLGGLVLMVLGILVTGILSWRKKGFSFAKVLLFPLLLVVPIGLVLPFLVMIRTELSSDHSVQSESVSFDQGYENSGAEIVTSPEKLSVESESDDLPEWVNQPDVVGQDSLVATISSQQYATEEEGDREILEKARRRVMDDFHKYHPHRGSWSIPVGLLNEQTLSQRHIEAITRKTNTATFEVYRVHRQLTLNSEIRETLYPVWRKQIVERRLLLLGALLVVATLILGTLASYFRLDQMTQGVYRWQLKLAAFSLIVACGLGAMLIA